MRCPDAQLWLPTCTFARNSSMTHSNIEFTSLELQRFCGISKNDRDKLRAKFGWRWCRHRPLPPGPAAHGCRSPRAPQPGPAVPPAPSAPVGPGVLTYDWVHRLVVRPGPAAAHGHRSLALRSLQCGLVRRAEISGCPDACCYKRRQSEVFFMWISNRLLQTSSI